jgi:hypothetical protein
VRFCADVVCENVGRVVEAIGEGILTALSVKSTTETRRHGE